MMRLSKWLWMAALLLSGAARADGHMVVVASGDCRDPDLLANTRLLEQELKGRVKDGLLDEEAFREQVAPPPTKGVEALTRQLEAAWTLFYDAKFSKAEVQVKEVLEEIARLPPGRERWALAVRAHLLHAMALRQEDHQELADQAFSWVLRLEPEYKLDPVDFSEGTRERFERLRKAMLTGKRVRLEVKSFPAGAEVFLDGFAVGKTPYQGLLPLGSYQVIVSKEGLTSLAHPVELKSPASVFVDLQFEGAIHPERAPCLSEAGGIGAGSEADHLSRALKLGTVLGVDEVVLLRLDRHGTGPGELVATALDVHSARKGREGKLPVQNPARTPEGLGELADFILTGHPGQKVRTVEPSAPSVAPALSPPAAASVSPTPRAPPAAPVNVPPKEAASAPPKTVAAAPPAPPKTVTAAAPNPALETRAAPTPKASAGLLSGRTWKTPWALGLAAAGVLAGGSGAFFQLQSAQQWSAFNRYYAGGAAPSRAQEPSVLALQQQANAQHALAVAGFVAGGALVAGGVTLFVLDAPRTSGRAPVSLGISASPTAVAMTVALP